MTEDEGQEKLVVHSAKVYTRIIIAKILNVLSVRRNLKLKARETWLREGGVVVSGETRERILLMEAVGGAKLRDSW